MASSGFNLPPGTASTQAFTIMWGIKQIDQSKQSYFNVSDWG